MSSIIRDFATVANNAKLNYWIDSSTLLVGAYGLNKKLTNYNLCILDIDEYNLLDLKYNLSSYGLEIIEYEGGFKIQRSDGFIASTYDDANYYTFSNQLQDKSWINVIVCVLEGDIVRYKNDRLYKSYPNSYHKKKSLYPLIGYSVNNVVLNGPKNPKPYIKRVYKN